MSQVREGAKTDRGAEQAATTTAQHDEYSAADNASSSNPANDDPSAANVATNGSQSTDKLSKSSCSASQSESTFNTVSTEGPSFAFDAVKFALH